jgi:hypothetical protein
VQFGSSSAPAQAEMLLNAAGQRGEHLETFFVCCSKAALTSAQYRSPLGRRPYDLRHAAVSLWLNSGVPATEVARRAGHGVRRPAEDLRPLHRRPSRRRQPAQDHVIALAGEKAGRDQAQQGHRRVQRPLQPVPPATARPITPPASSSAASPSRRSSPGHPSSSHRPGPAATLAESAAPSSSWPAGTADGTATGTAKYADNEAPAENVMIGHHTPCQLLPFLPPSPPRSRSVTRYQHQPQERIRWLRQSPDLPPRDSAWCPEPAVC